MIRALEFREQKGVLKLPWSGSLSEANRRDNTIQSDALYSGGKASMGAVGVYTHR